MEATRPFHSAHSFRLLALSVFLAFAAPAAAGNQSTDTVNRTVGKLLVATPEMTDPRFAESVIYIVRDNAEGTMGLIINRPIAKGPVKDLLKGFGIESEKANGDITIHYGGPMSTDHGFVLHSDDAMLDDSLPLKEGIAMTADAKLIEAIANGKGPRQFLILFGYAGWAPGQLAGEITAGAWHIVPADKSIVFGKDADIKWRQATDLRRIPL